MKKHKPKNMAKRIWKEAHCEVIGVMGKSSTLWIMCDPLHVKDERIHYSSNKCLSMKITCKNSRFSFYLSNIYAPNIDTSRRNF